MYKVIIYFFSVIVITSMETALSAETCSRLAVINFQEVLVDTTSTEKGGGLKFYLEKDPQAYEYLKKYQKGTQIKTANVIMGTTGTLLFLSSLFVDKDQNRSKQQRLMLGGLGLLALNFLVGKTLEYNNEENLEKAIEEYNKRNFPKILLSPLSDATNKIKSWEIVATIGRSF